MNCLTPKYKSKFGRLVGNPFVEIKRNKNINLGVKWRLFLNLYSQS